MLKQETQAYEELAKQLFLESVDLHNAQVNHWTEKSILNDFPVLNSCPDNLKPGKINFSKLNDDLLENTCSCHIVYLYNHDKTESFQ